MHTVRKFWIMATMVAACAVTLAETSHTKTSRYCHLELARALPGDKPMNLSLAIKDGKVVAAFASARTFNAMAYTVDAAGVKVSESALRGPIKVTVPSDGWVPAGGKTLTCTYDLSVALKDESASGTFTGQAGTHEVAAAATGSVGERAMLPQRCRFILHARAPKGDKRALGRVGIELGMRDGKAQAVKLIPHGSITDIGAATLVDASEIDFDGRTLRGAIQGQLISNGRDPQKLQLDFECVVIGHRVSGKFRSTVDGKYATAGGIRGEMDLSPVADAANCLWELTLHHGVDHGRMINVFLSTLEGKVSAAYAVTPNFNNATHAVDAGKLRLEDGRLTGPLFVTVYPDAWIPKDHKKRSASYIIDVRRKDAELVGTYEGTFAGQAVKGDVTGHTAAKPEIGQVTHATIKPEGGLYNGAWSGYRAFFTFDVEDGKITSGRVWNNHDKKLKGTITSGTFRVEGDALTAEMVATIEPGTSAKPGTYTIRVEGPVMGTGSCGQAVSKLGDKTWTSRYWASWKYEADK